MSDRKAKRRLTDISFDHEGAHLALVHKGQGGPANGYTTLVTKALDAGVPQDVLKATKVKVELEFPEFLRKFFGMYYSEAEMLSAALGYGTTEGKDWQMDGESYQEYIERRVGGIEILKSLYKSEDPVAGLNKLDDAAIVSIAKARDLLEPHMATASGADHTNKEESPVSQELIDKAVQAAEAKLQDELKKQADLLKAATEQIAAMEAIQKAAKVEARKAAVAGSGADAEAQVELMKAMESLSDESFAVVLKHITKAKEVPAGLDREVGLSGASDAENASQVETLKALMLAKYTKQ
ncbi:hypothetical protein [Pseudomonas phage vB_PaeM_PAO1_Ab17]|uniref:Uncharacterized protein n=3 Tax=root TaxID=1 RepID=A0A0A1IWH4_9CAUD|nr:hypothetical protein VC54_gp151 [Pseudomonas phage vB_PaeM_PAO1_Ab03]CEF89165.1 hypothetical protein [Pseudomonas phage vB_PaeM_PAO1_Ab03]CEF89549.1 hypothetical protein [Pseudomonas phage vB_PaeM_PAO1_Ab17]